MAHSLVLYTRGYYNIYTCGCRLFYTQDHCPTHLIITVRLRPKRFASYFKSRIMYNMSFPPRNVKSRKNVLDQICRRHNNNNNIITDTNAHWWYFDVILSINNIAQSRIPIDRVCNVRVFVIVPYTARPRRSSVHSHRYDEQIVYELC